MLRRNKETKLQKRLQKEPALEQAALWLENYYPSLLSGVGTIIIAVVGVIYMSAKNNWVLALIIGCVGVAAIAGEVVLILRQPKIRTLQKEKEDLENKVEKLELTLEQRAERLEGDYYNIIQNQLIAVARNVRLNNDDRVSLYSHDKASFWMLGRYSINPNLKERGRSHYPEDQGVIGQAWRDGNAYADSLPDPLRNEDEYFEELKSTYNIPKGVAREFTMRSRCIVAFAVSDSTESQRKAVIVFESLNEEQFIFGEFQEHWDGWLKAMLAHLIESLESIAPVPEFAREEGF